jgi:hypothetical protein
MLLKVDDTIVDEGSATLPLLVRPNGADHQ